MKPVCNVKDFLPVFSGIQKYNYIYLYTRWSGDGIPKGGIDLFALMQNELSHKILLHIP